MPASEFAWAAEARLPIFQVYGTKRKAPQEGGQHWAGDMLQQNEPNSAKRACLYGANEGQDESLMCTDTSMDNNNTLILHPQQFHQQQQQLQPHQNDIAWLQQPPPQQAAQQPCPPTHQPGGVMDLCGETFSSSNRADGTDEALMAMDSDFTPNPEQYRSAEAAPSASLNVPDVRSNFCNEYCGVGEPSPTSSCVRCYCKPSWEGMMTMRPYISDIY